MYLIISQNERILFHYNGHGVPRPTANGEVRRAADAGPHTVTQLVFALHCAACPDRLCTPLPALWSVTSFLSMWAVRTMFV